LEKEIRNEYVEGDFNHYSVVYRGDTFWVDIWLGKYEMADRMIC
jgi:hypothetical protein